MLEHYFLLHNIVGFLLTQYWSFPNTDLEDLSQVSETLVKVISKDREVIHEDFEIAAKEAREDHRHTSLECSGGII